MLTRPRFPIRAFLRRRRGATAVEFSFIIGPLLALILGVIEVSIAHMNNSKVLMSTQKIVRLIETGEGRCMAKNDVRDRLCSYLEVKSASECLSDVRIVVNSMADMLDQPNISFAQAENIYEPGEGGDRMSVRVFQRHETFFPYLGALLGAESGQGGSGNGLILQAAQIFKNEPFNSSTPCASEGS